MHGLRKGAKLREGRTSVLRTIRSGRRILDDMMPILDFAMPYEAPKEVKTMAAAQPMAPKKG